MIFLSLGDKPTRRFSKKECARNQDDQGDGLDRKGTSPLGIAGKSDAKSISSACGDEDCGLNHQHLETAKGTTYLWRGDFGSIDWEDCEELTGAEARDEASKNEHRNVDGTSLKGDAYHGNSGSSAKAPQTTQRV